MSLGVLRAVVNRLNSTPSEDLPSQVGFLATSLANCKDVLQSPSSTNDHSVILHRLRTKTSALLQDRTSEGRFAGIVLAKALVEAGGSTILAESGSWTKNLISCLNKADSWEVKRLCVVTISRIYLLSASQQALTREITIPTLPAFISASLNIIKPTTSNQEGKITHALSPLLSVVLRSWHALIKHFASTIRPNVASIRSICLSLISDESCEAEVQSAAYSVLARLHFCAPKNAAATDWSENISRVIEAVHDTADVVFRAVVEDWTSNSARTSKVTRKQKTTGLPRTANVDVAGLEKWSGVSQGCSRLVTHVSLIQAIMTGPHLQHVNLPLGAVLDLTSRLSAVTIPTSKYSLRTNNEITRDEREELWLNLPNIHIAVLRLLLAIVQILGRALYPISSTLNSQMWDIFEADCFDESMRAITYDLVAALIKNGLLPFIKSESSNIKKLVSYCCNDLISLSGLKVEGSGSLTNANTSIKTSIANTVLSIESAHVQNTNPVTSPANPQLHSAAHALLPTLLTFVPFHLLTSGSAIRAQAERTAILTNHSEAVLASVLCPLRSRQSSNEGKVQQSNPSILPFLVRMMEEPENSAESQRVRLAVEALLRPRMPMIASIITNKAPREVEETEGDESNLEEATEYAKALPNMDKAISWSDQSEQVSDQHRISSKLASEGFDDATVDHQALQRLTNTQKRDFTTLLEQSADAQLAMSTSNDNFEVHDGPQVVTDTTDSLSKRPRIDTVPSATASDSEAGKQSGSRSPTITLVNATTATFQRVDETNKAVLPDEPATKELSKGMETAWGEGDSDSDSDVPLIDATLLGVSDSEDGED